MITFINYKNFRLVNIGLWELERNTTAGRNWEALTAVIHGTFPHDLNMIKGVKF
jgi:hypothetical protein